MKRKLEDKLKEFSDIRKFANGLQRKKFIDQEVRVYLVRKCSEVQDYEEAYKTYKEMYSDR